ncbi:Ger(x)C family spore germination C-terminal domain-containing protein, partial [Bacillus velezensis]
LTVTAKARPVVLRLRDRPAAVRDQVRIHYPDKWKKISSDWDHHFSESDIEYKVKVAIRDFGTKGMSQ